MIGEVEKVFLQIDSVLTEVITAKQAAYRYKFAERTIRQWCDESKVKFADIEGRLWIPISEIEKYLARRDYK